MKTITFCILALTILYAQSVYSQNICTICEQLLNNVVRIQTTFNDGSDEHGFGFVVGERNNKLYIVTAKHVIYALDGNGIISLDKKTKSVSVTFHSDLGRDYPATLLTLPNTPLDISLLEVRKLENYLWQKNSSSTAIQTGTTVWFIGKARKWYIPTGPFSGSINQISAEDEILVDINSIAPGTSGAPLISQNGIVGLIFQDAASGAIAYPIEKVMRLIKGWNYPWQMNPAKNSDSELVTDEEITRKIVGTWKGTFSCEGHHCEATISYDSNGYFTGVTIVNSQIYYKYSGSWRVTDGENVLIVTNSSNQLFLPIGTRLISKILTITNDTCDYIDYMGTQRTAYRLD